MSLHNLPGLNDTPPSRSSQSRQPGSSGSRQPTSRQPESSFISMSIGFYMFFINGICTSCATLPGLTVNLVGQTVLEQIRGLIRLIPFIGGEIANGIFNIGVTDLLNSVCFMGIGLLAFTSAVLLFTRNPAAANVVKIVCIARLILFALSIFGGYATPFAIVGAIMDAIILVWAFQS